MLNLNQFYSGNTQMVYVVVLTNYQFVVLNTSKI